MTAVPRIPGTFRPPKTTVPVSPLPPSTSAVSRWSRARLPYPATSLVGSAHFPCASPLCCPAQSARVISNAYANASGRSCVTRMGTGPRTTCACVSRLTYGKSELEVDVRVVGDAEVVALGEPDPAGEHDQSHPDQQRDCARHACRQRRGNGGVPGADLSKGD